MGILGDLHTLLWGLDPTSSNSETAPATGNVDAEKKKTEPEKKKEGAKPPEGSEGK